MNYSDILLTASANMLRNKARTALTVVAVFIGAFTIALTSSIGSGVNIYLHRQIGNLGANNILQVSLRSPGDRSSLDTTPQKYDPNHQLTALSRGRPQVRLMNNKDIERIRSQKNITNVQPEREIALDYLSAGGQKYQASIMQQFGSADLDMLSGRTVDNGTESNEITIPESFVKPLGFTNDSDAVGKLLTIGISDALGQRSEVEAMIVGIQQKTLLGSITSYANTSLADQLYGAQAVGLPANSQNKYPIVIATFKHDLTDAEVTTLKEKLKEKGYDAKTVEDQVSTVFTVVNSIIIVLNLFGVIALLAATFGIINTLYMAVAERTKEIGLMKALGMGPRKIFILFSVEAVLIGFWGSVLGVLTAFMAGIAVNIISSNTFLKNFEGLRLSTFPPFNIILIIVGIMFIAFLAGTLPALRASRKNPIEALRYE